MQDWGLWQSNKLPLAHNKTYITMMGTQLGFLFPTIRPLDDVCSHGFWFVCKGALN